MSRYGESYEDIAAMMAYEMVKNVSPAQAQREQAKREIKGWTPAEIAAAIPADKREAVWRILDEAQQEAQADGRKGGK